MKKLRIGIWVLVAIMAGFLGAGSYYFTGKSAPGATDGPFGVPFTLVAQNGQPITEAAFRGRPSAVFFGYTHCPDVCPTTLFEMDGWLQKVDPDGSKLGAYFVTVDPERDTPAVMNEYVSNVSKRITGISGPTDKVTEMVHGFRVYAVKVPIDAKNPGGDYTMDHSASVYLLDSQGRFAGTIAYQENPDTAVKKLENLINKR